MSVRLPCAPVRALPTVPGVPAPSIAPVRIADTTSDAVVLSTSVSLVMTLPVALTPGVPLATPPASVATVAPALALVSFTPTGASFTGLMVSLKATVADEICVVPPVAPVRLIVAPLVIVRPLSIKLALSAVAEPL